MEVCISLFASSEKLRFCYLLRRGTGDPLIERFALDLGDLKLEGSRLTASVRSSLEESSISNNYLNGEIWITYESTSTPGASAVDL